MIMITYILFSLNRPLHLMLKIAPSKPPPSPPPQYKKEKQQQPQHTPVLPTTSSLLVLPFWGQIGVELNFQSNGAHYRLVAASGRHINS